MYTNPLNFPKSLHAHTATPYANLMRCHLIISALVFPDEIRHTMQRDSEFMSTDVIRPWAISY